MSIGDDRSRVRDSRRSGEAQEFGGQPQRSPLADEGLTAEPSDRKASHRREFRRHEAQQALLDGFVQERRVFCLVAVRAVEVAAEAGDDGEMEGVRVASGALVAFLEEGYL